MPDLNKNSFLIIIAAMLLACLLVGCSGGGQADTAESEAPRTKIGVSIWSSTDVLGSRCKDILWEAGEALELELVFEDTGYQDVPGSVQRLIDAGCSAIIVCNSSDDEMRQIIDMCDANGVYVAQFFKHIDESDETVYDTAKSSAHYVGDVREDEKKSGSLVTDALIEAGVRRIAPIGTISEDDAWQLRYAGIVESVEKWNDRHPDDTVKLLKPHYAGVTVDGGHDATLEILEDDRVDGIVCSGGGGEALIGTINAIRESDRKLYLTSTDFIDDLGKQMTEERVLSATGGSYCDPLFALMMVYDAQRNEIDLSGKCFDLVVEPTYIDSSIEFDEYKHLFYDNLPYTDDEIRELSLLTPKQLEMAALKLSIEDARGRAEERRLD